MLVTVFENTTNNSVFSGFLSSFCRRHSPLHLTLNYFTADFTREDSGPIVYSWPFISLLSKISTSVFLWHTNTAVNTGLLCSCRSQDCVMMMMMMKVIISRCKEPQREKKNGQEKVRACVMMQWNRCEVQGFSVVPLCFLPASEPHCSGSNRRKKKTHPLSVITETFTLIMWLQ